MKYIRQFTIILTISFIGEILHALIPFPIPASIYGLVLMLTALLTGILKLSQVKDASRFLIEIMPMMFIPASAGLIDSWGVLKPVLVPVLVIMIITTFVVMGVAGRVTQMLIQRQSRHSADHKEEES
ncbi:MAG: CidA/LrgA family protein [Lachnospiraceae bacterium]|nr:CidA/LrgA family protein [Lachnospiraceae bacterium]